MKKHVVALAGTSVLLSLLVAGSALAGAVSNVPVTFFTESNGQLSVKGNLRTVRNTADTVQYIGCSIYAYASGSYSIVCTSRDATGQTRNCQTGDANMIKQAQSINPASYIYFSLKPDGVTCDRLIVVNESFNM